MEGKHKPGIIEVEALIVGSGPLGCTFARKLVDGGHKVLMIDIGEQLSQRPGHNLRNGLMYQKDFRLFQGVVISNLQPLSIAADRKTEPDLPPEAFKIDFSQHEGFVCVGQNPDQDASDNIPMAAATYAVGGMATHWNGNIPREHPTVERSDLLTDTEWDELYEESESLLGKSESDLFPISIRHTVVAEALKKAYPKLSPQRLAYAARKSDGSQFVTWSGADTVLGDRLVKMIEDGDERMTLKATWQCVKLQIAKSGDRIEQAIVKDLTSGQLHHVRAKVFVVAAGALLTPQVLFSSGVRPEALGRYLCDQPVASCQVVLRRDIVEAIPGDPRWKEVVETHQKEHPEDPVPIPLGDPDPRCWIPVSEDHPWNSQVTRDVLYGPSTQNVDKRLIVDFMWCGRAQPRFENRVTFSEKVKDMFGMPQPTFHYKMTNEDQAQADDMLADMCRAAKAVGSYLPGSEPRMAPPGQSLHITGTCRMGRTPEDSVVDTHSRVWHFTNLYLGSCGVIPTGTACNPTNTAVALAVRASNKILEEFRAGKFQ